MPWTCGDKNQKTGRRSSVSSNTLSRAHPLEDAKSDLKSLKQMTLKAQGLRPKVASVKLIKGARSKDARMEHGLTVNDLRKVLFACLFGTSEASRMGQVLFFETKEIQ